MWPVTRVLHTFYWLTSLLNMLSYTLEKSVILFPQRSFYKPEVHVSFYALYKCLFSTFLYFSTFSAGIIILNIIPRNGSWQVCGHVRGNPPQPGLSIPL